MEDNRHYVYQIVDPRTKKVLYIGKGTGGRCYFHFTISRKNSAKGDEALFKILSDILDNTNYTQFDCVQILHNRLSDKEAKKIELDLIKSIGYDNLYNISTKAQWMNGSKWMNNGLVDRQFLVNQDIPAEFCYKGRIKNPSWKSKNVGKVWITNGIDNKMVADYNNLNPGWFLGKTTRRKYGPAWNKGLTKNKI